MDGVIAPNYHYAVDYMRPNGALVTKSFVGAFAASTFADRRRREGRPVRGPYRCLGDAPNLELGWGSPPRKEEKE